MAELLEPIYRRMVSHVVQSRKIHTDDMPVKVLEPGMGKTRTARFCVYLGDQEHPFIVFETHTGAGPGVVGRPCRQGPAEESARAGDHLHAKPVDGADAFLIEDGDLEADNNVENALRPKCLGRKNFLFVGSDAGGRRAAILYSLVRSCERHDVNAWQYLRDVLIRISTHPASQIDDLLPHRWTAQK